MTEPTCPACAHAIDDTVRLCERCGHTFAAAPSEPTTLGDAILRARTLTLSTGEGHTVALRGDADFCVMPSANYARLRETSMHGGIEPLLSFLPRGGIDVHRASFQPIAKAMLAHSNWPR